jgi:hypothetical protein
MIEKRSERSQARNLPPRLSCRTQIYVVAFWHQQLARTRVVAPMGLLLSVHKDTATRRDAVRCEELGSSGDRGFGVPAAMAATQNDFKDGSWRWEESERTRALWAILHKAFWWVRPLVMTLSSLM